MTPRPALSARECLPRNPARSLLIGRAWIPAEDGPAVFAVRGDDAVDLTGSYPTVSRLLNTARPGDVRAAIQAAPSVGRLEAIIGNSAEGHRDPSKSWLLAPCDLQAVKASGVTFIASLLERVIEERAKGKSRPRRRCARRDPVDHRARSPRRPPRVRATLGIRFLQHEDRSGHPVSRFLCPG